MLFETWSQAHAYDPSDFMEIRLQRRKVKCEAFMSLHSLCEQSVWRCNYFLQINPKSNSISTVQIKKILW